MSDVPSLRPAGAPSGAQPLDERLRALVDEALAGTDLQIVDLAVRGYEGSRIVEVFLDSPDGAGSDDLVQATRKIGFLLDAEDPVKGRYRLDVSTPGADRPLTEPFQFPRHVGRTLSVQTPDGPVSGELTAVTGDALTLTLPPASKKAEPETRTIPFSDLTSARVELPW